MPRRPAACFSIGDSGKPGNHGARAQFRVQVVAGAVAGEAKDELDPLSFGRAVFGDDPAALPLQRAAIGLGAVRGSRFGQSFDLDAEGRAGIEEVNQREGEQGDYHGEMQQTEAGDKARQGDNDQTDGVARRVRGGTEADQAADAENDDADHGAEFTNSHTNYRADYSVHDIHMRHVRLM